MAGMRISQLASVCDAFLLRELRGWLAEKASEYAEYVVD